MSEHNGPFSRRHGFKLPDAEITVHDDAPDVVREGLVMLGRDLGLSPDEMRIEVCKVLLRQPDRGNWSASNVASEVEYLVGDAPWFKVYDLAERLYAKFGQTYHPERAKELQIRLNELFWEHGVGYAMQDGLIIARGSEVFSIASNEAQLVMAASRKTTAKNEMHEALRDISRRPADITGAIQHAMASLECIARDVSGQHSKNLSQIVPTLGLPRPLDEALTKLWAFTSQEGRHLQEGRNPGFKEAELVVTVASAVSVYLLRATQPLPR
ncbi:MAG: hypothetical protein NTV73_02465 [Hyphomicrobiales bacterium]|nr:hypothetical protein [Hyphomicrobiales bacterium]